MNYDVHVEYWKGGVVYVEIKAFGFKRRLQGFDHYWLDWPKYGAFNSEVRFGEKYANGCIAFEMNENGEKDLGRLKPNNKEVGVLNGVMLPEDLAEEYGLV